MTIFGKPYSAYLRFQGWFLILIAVVGIGRLELSRAGVSTSIDKYLSVTAVLLIGLVLFAVIVHSKGFGGYKQLLVVYWNNAMLANLIVSLGILIAIRTGRDNIYTVPEYSGGVDGKTWLHLVAHLAVGAVIFPLIAWGIGSLLMFVTKKAVKPSAA